MHRKVEGPLSEDPSTQEIHRDHGRVLTTEATIKIKHLGEVLIRMEPPHMFLATIADEKKKLLHGEKGRETAKNSP